MSLLVIIVFFVGCFVLGWLGPVWFGNKFYLGQACIWSMIVIYSTVTGGNLGWRAVNLGLVIIFFAIWWNGRPPKDHGKLRRAIGARMQAIIDRMTEIARPAHGNFHA